MKNLQMGQQEAETKVRQVRKLVDEATELGVMKIEDGTLLWYAADDSDVDLDVWIETLSNSIESATK